MTFPVLESASSAAIPLKYSEDKLNEGTVSILCSGNLPECSLSLAKTAFLERESHPSLSRKAKRLAFHVAVNPGEEDAITDKQMPDMIRDWMEGMGYGEQPYIVFRHNDIEREHYHIVSTNILPNGRVIRSSFVGLRALMVGRTLEKKYGFVMGKADKEQKPVRSLEELMGPRLRFRPEVPVREQFTAILRRAQEYNYESYAQYLAVLAAYGMHLMAVKGKDDKWKMKAYAADESGRKISRIYDMDKMLRKDIVTEFEKRRDENYARERVFAAPEAVMGAAAVICLKWARSYQEYRAMIRSIGLDMYTYRDNEGALVDVSIVDKKHGRVESVSVLEPSLTTEEVSKVFNSQIWRQGPKVTTVQMTQEELGVIQKEADRRFDEMLALREAKKHKSSLTI